MSVLWCSSSLCFHSLQVLSSVMASALPRTLGELQLYRILQKANLLFYFDAFIQQGGDDVQQLCEAGEEEFLEIMALVGMASKPLHVRRLQKALRDWVTNPGLFNQPLTSLPVSSIPIYKLPEGSPAWLGISCSSYERNSSTREPHLKIPKCAATTCVQSVGTSKSDVVGSLSLQSSSEPRLWQGHHTTESEHSLSPADLGSPASPKENSETLDAAAALSVAECVERMVPSLPKSDSNEVKELLKTNKKLAKMIGHIFEMSDDDPHKEEEIRKYSAIYGRFDSKRKDGKHLTLHEVKHLEWNWASSPPPAPLTRGVYRVHFLDGHFLLSEGSCVSESCVLSAVGSPGLKWKSQVQHKSPFVGGCGCVHVVSRLGVTRLLGHSCGLSDRRFRKFGTKIATSIALSVALGILRIWYILKDVLSWYFLAVLRVDLFGSSVTENACV